jgi:hypothetical protein
VAVAPARLERVTANHLPAYEFETRGRITYIRPRNVSENIRLATTSRTGTGPPKPFEREVGFHPITPSNGQLIPDQLDIGQIKTHRSEVRELRAQIKLDDLG